MGRRFKQFDSPQVGGGGPVQATSFIDTFVRANKDTLGFNWMRSLSNTPGGAGGNSLTAVAAINTNQATFTTISGAGPVNIYAPLWVPLPIYYGLYNAGGYFAQWTFQSATAGLASGLALRYNHDLNNTETQAEGSDFYDMLTNGQIGKTVGGAARSVIGAATWAPVANDVHRFECLTSGASVVLQAIRNGAILQTITDSSATRILSGTLGVVLVTANATILSLVISSFSCGPLTALST